MACLSLGFLGHQCIIRSHSDLPDSSVSSGCSSDKLKTSSNQSFLPKANLLSLLAQTLDELPFVLDIALSWTSGIVRSSGAVCSTSWQRQQTQTSNREADMVSTGLDATQSGRFLADCQKRKKWTSGGWY